MNPLPKYQPPRPVPLAPVRVGPAPRLDISHVHPDVLENERRAAERLSEAVAAHRWIGLAFGLVTAAFAVFTGYSITHQIGWWVIIPPVFVVLFLSGFIAFVAALALKTLAGFVLRLVSRQAFDDFNYWSHAAMGTFGGIGAIAGTAIGYLAAVIVGIVR